MLFGVGCTIGVGRTGALEALFGVDCTIGVGRTGALEAPQSLQVRLHLIMMTAGASHPRIALLQSKPFHLLQPMDGCFESRQIMSSSHDETLNGVQPTVG